MGVGVSTRSVDIPRKDSTRLAGGGVRQPNLGEDRIMETLLYSHLSEAHYPCSQKLIPPGDLFLSRTLLSLIFAYYQIGSHAPANVLFQISTVDHSSMPITSRSFTRRQQFIRTSISN